MIKESIIRMTRQRQVILEELRNVTSHPSADEVYAMVRRRLKRFDGIAENHYHIRCIRCDRVVDAPVDFHPEIGHELKAATDFKILGHKLEFIGVCPECNKASEPI